MLRVILVLGCICSVFLSFAQSYDAQISGTIQYDDGAEVADVTLTLFQGKDSISSTKSNQHGEFFLEVKLDDQSDYYLLLVDGMPEFLQKDKFTISTGLDRNDFVFNIVYPIPRVEKTSGQVAFYPANETKKFEEFEIEQIHRIIDKYPNVCIEFSQTLARTENEKIADKRKTNFLKSLKEAGVDMSCIRFDDQTRILQAVNEDQRSRIQGAIYSIDSKCP